MKNFRKTVKLNRLLTVLDTSTNGLSRLFASESGKLMDDCVTITFGSPWTALTVLGILGVE